VLLAAAIGAVVWSDAWVYSCGFAGCPSAREIRAFRPDEGGRILDRTGAMLARLAPVRRVNVPLASVPAQVRAAFIATEDRRFYDHHGFDGRAALRALARNVAALGVREGFSTITMQVARNTFAVRRYANRSLPQKLIEMRLARLLERNLSKDQILELYLNVIYLGNGVYGVEAASRDLFGKGVAHVSLSEAAVLAALPKGPSAYTPRRSPKRALARRNLVLGLMREQGYLTASQMDAAQRAPLRVAADEWRPADAGDSYAYDLVRAFADSLLRAKSLDAGDVTVLTTLDGPAQRSAERAVQRQATTIDRESAAYYGRRSAHVEGALVAIDPRTGSVRALVGGRSYERKGFNRAVSAHRQPGSAFKPFVYEAALAGGMTPATYVDDEPVEVEENGKVWAPENFGGEYEGRITLRRALMRSANAATVRVSRTVGEEAVVAAARRNGVTSPLAAVPSIALGALEVTPIELVTAYAPFANGGYRVSPRLVLEVRSADGERLWAADSARRTPVMDPRDAYQLTSMLRSVVDYGTGHAVRAAGVRGAVAGKTGTTNNGADVWFVGYTPTLAAAVWFGYDTPRAISGDASGGRLAAPAWADFYRTGWRETAAPDAWSPPPGMRAVAIDAESGELATEWCPNRQTAWFRPGTEPTEPCHLHPDPDDGFPLPDASQIPQRAGEIAADVGTKIGRALKKIFKW
jgi:penicillin-binding protein 1A